MRVILISGWAESGKDFVGEQFMSMIKERNQTGLVMHFADMVKYVCERYFNWDGQKDMKGRSLLQYVGTDMRLEHNPYIWASMTYELAKFLNQDDNYDYVIIPDWRFYVELWEGQSEFNDNLSTVRVRRWEDFEATIPYENHLTQEQREHPSECELNNVLCDYYIDNCPNSEYNNLIRMKKIINKVLNGEKE